jgi:hypothetical protein
MFKKGKNATAVMMVAAALGAYTLTTKPALAEQWCTSNADGGCNDYCGNRGHGWYCCLTTQAGGYSCTCYDSAGDCN